MSGLFDAWRWLRVLARRRDLEDALDEEIRFHIDRQTENIGRSVLFVIRGSGDRRQPWKCVGPMLQSPLALRR